MSDPGDEMWDREDYPPDDDRAYRYAARLAIAFWEKHWKDEAPDWKPLPDLIGVLTQIDNMTAGMARAHGQTAGDEK